MDDLRESMELEALEEFLAEEFNPDLFYEALTNALQQLEQIEAQEAA